MIFCKYEKRFNMAKKNIGASLALYPCPVIVVGAMNQL